MLGDGYTVFLKDDWGQVRFFSENFFFSTTIDVAVWDPKRFNTPLFGLPFTALVLAQRFASYHTVVFGRLDKQKITNHQCHALDIDFWIGKTICFYLHVIHIWI